MKKKPYIHIFVWNLILLSPGLVLFSGCSQAESKETKQIIYVCSETKEIFSGHPMKVPVLNPHTGKETLQNGLYCNNCETWHVVPPLELTGGNHVTIKCAETDIDLVSDGPIPEKVFTLGGETDFTKPDPD